MYSNKALIEHSIEHQSPLAPWLHPIKTWWQLQKLQARLDYLVSRKEDFEISNMCSYHMMHDLQLAVAETRSEMQTLVEH